MQARKNQALAPATRSQRRGAGARKGALALPALTEAVGLKGFSARGKVILALNDMVAQGKVRTIPAPDGTPQLQKVNFIKYELAGVAARSLTLRRRRARRGASACRRRLPASCRRSCRAVALPLAALAPADCGLRTAALSASALSVRSQ